MKTLESLLSAEFDINYDTTMFKKFADEWFQNQLIMQSERYWKKWGGTIPDDRRGTSKMDDNMRKLFIRAMVDGLGAEQITSLSQRRSVNERITQGYMYVHLDTYDRCKMGLSFRSRKDCALLYETHSITSPSGMGSMVYADEDGFLIPATIGAELIKILQKNKLW